MSLIPPPPPGTFDPNPHREQRARVQAAEWDLHSAIKMRQLYNRALMNFFGIKMLKDFEMSQKVLNTLERVCLDADNQVFVQKQAAASLRRSSNLTLTYRHYTLEAIKQLQQKVDETRKELADLIAGKQ